MSIKAQSPLKKSQTHSFALPKISKTTARYHGSKTSRFTPTNMSAFLERVQPLTKNVEYREMETTTINEEHKKLKGLLRQFNAQTYEILGKYIDRPLEEDKKKSKHSSFSMVEIRDKELANNSAILQICRKQLENLEQRSKNLKYVTVEQYERKLNELKYQIGQEELILKEISKGNILRGQQIKKDETKNYNEVSDSQYEIYILSLKKERLQAQTKYVNDEEASLKPKITQLDQKIKSLQEGYIKALKEDEAEKQKQKIKEQIEGKRKNYKQKKDNDHNNKYQFLYLKNLKELDETRKRLKKIEEETKLKSQQIDQTKKELAVQEHKFSLLKKKDPSPPKKSQK